MDGRQTEAAGWRYEPSPAPGLLEVGTLRGGAAGLATHFHDEMQITVVLSGRRRMRIGGRAIELGPGRCVCIPAGVPHSGAPEPADVTGIIAYAMAGDYDLSGLCTDIETLWRTVRALPWSALAAIVVGHRRDRSPEPPAPIMLPTRARMSREGFSRRFARQTGMPPHAFEVATRLNKARRMLRAGTPIVDVAVATRFADQSHFGRCFRRAFGVTPGAYGRDYRSVTNVPDV